MALLPYLSTIVIAGAAIYVAALAGVFIGQRKFLYFPDHVYVSPSKAVPYRGFQELPVRTEDGLDLRGWYAPATSRLFTLVFFHGNGDSLRSVAFVALPYIDAGYGFLLAEYRGYSRLPGRPTESGLYADGRAFLNKMISSGVKDTSLILFGSSLGTGVAVQMASEFHIGGLILMAPFLSIPKLAQRQFPVFPADYLTLDRYENFKKIPGIHAPLLIANGGKDGVIPPSEGRRLFALANEPKQYYFMPENGHNDLFGSVFTAFSLSWLQKLAAQDAASR